MLSIKREDGTHQRVSLHDRSKTFVNDPVDGGSLKIVQDVERVDDISKRGGLNDEILLHGDLEEGELQKRASSHAS